MACHGNREFQYRMNIACLTATIMSIYFIVSTLWARAGNGIKVRVTDQDLYQNSKQAYNLRDQDASNKTVDAKLDMLANTGVFASNDTHYYSRLV